MMRFSNSRIDTLKINLTRSILVLFVATTWLLGEEIVLREDFRESPAHIPIAQQDLTNGRFLSLQRLGSSSERLKLSYHPNKANDPHYLWNGMTSSPSAVLFHFDSPVDLSAAQSRIRVRTKNVGGSTMHLALKIGDDQWIASERSVESTKDWVVSEHVLADQSWQRFSPDSLTIEGVNHDYRLQQVSGIGFVFPKEAKGSKDCVRLDWFELLSSSLVIPTQELSYGPFFEPSAHAIRSGFVFEDGESLNRTRRGVILKLSDTKWLGFDPDLLRCAAVWEAEDSSEPISLDSMPAISYPTAKAKAKRVPSVKGKLLYHQAELPGVARGAALPDIDPRKDGTGPMPLDGARWLGIESTDTSAPVLVYRIGDREIKERFSSGEGEGFVRLIELGQGQETVSMVVGGRNDQVVLSPGDHSGVELRHTEEDGAWLVCKPSTDPRSIQVSINCAIANSNQSDADKLSHFEGSVSVESPTPTDKSKRNLGIRYLNLPSQNPWQRAIRPVDLAFRKNGDCFVAGFDGDIWKVTDIDQVSATWQRVASGIYEPMAIEAGSNDALFVLGRDQITELVDTNSDGVFDQYLCRSDQFIQSLHTRDYSTSMAIQSDGSFIIAKGGIYRPQDPDSATEELSRHRGAILKISPDGKSITTLAEGLRMPFVGLTANDIPIVSDQQGQFVPTTPIHIIKPSDKPSSHGFVATNHQQIPLTEPAFWLPHNANQSAAGFLPIRSKSFPDLVGSTVHFAWNGKLFVIPESDENGFAWSFSDQFEMPLLNADIHPVTGKMFAVGLGISGYKTSTKLSAGIAEITQNQRFAAPQSLIASPNHIKLTFHSPLQDPAPTVTQNQLKAYNVIRTKNYGSGHYRYDGTPGERTIPVTGQSLSDDRKTLTISVAPPLFDYSVVRFGLNFGEDTIDLYTTTRGLPEPTEEQLALLKVGVDSEDHPVTPGDTAQGKLLFQSLGCVTCHSLTGEKLNGPPLTDKSYDLDYLEESILYPAKKVADGFQPNMPSYQGIVSKQQLEDVIAYLQSISSESK